MGDEGVLLLNPGEDIVCGLLARFVVNLPEHELVEWNRLLYHVEKMWWFYLDHSSSLSRRQRLYYSNHVESFCTFVQWVLRQFVSVDLKPMIAEYGAFKRQIPVAGCALFDPDHRVLLVRPAGLSRWAFPKGKINAGETLNETAARETAEEANYHLTSCQIKQLAEGPRWTLTSSNSKYVYIFPLMVPNKNELIPNKNESSTYEIDEVAWWPCTPTPSIPLTQLASKIWPLAISHLRSKNHVGRPQKSKM